MSKSVFIIHNQDNHYLDTENQWAMAGSEQQPFFSPHRDVAVNKLFEMTLHDANLRGKVIPCPADERGKPLLEEIGIEAPGQACSKEAGDALTEAS